ncbi:hypothetical protein PR202_ga05923 [Eleusine coracana subsp. coracana]|uniref:RING-type E3 ubiquitin transferase n=1 Tax=Eleusine coracana subsp. coracana TaxID=191504 RepID=A0AAV5BVE2_ELECO|nr:hypothetical protein PR202_ga05923 [Eleusine coracana subsp. coracana]
MAPLPANPSCHPLLVLPLLLLLLIPASEAAATSLSAFSYAAHCSALPAAPDLPVVDSSAQLPTLQLSTGYFSGGGVRLFGPEPSSLPPRSFSLLPSSVLRTTNASLLHVSATLTVSGGRHPLRVLDRGRNLFEYDDGHAHYFRPRLPRFTGRRGSITFGLEGYYSTASGELCMVGTGSGRAADGSPVHFLPVVLRVGFPSPANLTRSFVTGRLESPDSPSPLQPISLVAFAEEGYVYDESASCPAPPVGRLDALHVFEGRNFSCPQLNLMLKTPFKLQYREGSNSTASSLGLHQIYMYINRMHCVLMMVLSVPMWRSQNQTEPSRTISCADLTVGECGIGMSFWFPSVWSIEQRSFAAGLLWNASMKSGEAIAAGSSAITPNFRGNLAGLKYNYTKLFHVKKIPEALPAMSITMLVVLALGYMIPLVLNFEALFKNSNKQTVPLSGGGWLEVNEVMVRIITMITFLLQLRLLQLAWSARSADFNRGRRMLRQVVHMKPIVHTPTFWEDLVSYGGLILDGFLLPQNVVKYFAAFPCVDLTF